MSLPYMQFYPADYFAKTRRLTCLEHGAYLQLLLMMWEANGALKFDAQDLADELGLSVDEFNQVWQRVGRYFQMKKGRIYNKRISEDLAGKKGISEKRKNAAKIRWSKNDNENNDQFDANALQSDPILQKPEPEPDTKNDDDSAGANDWPELDCVLEDLRTAASLMRADWQGHTASVILGWKNQGYSFKLDVVPAVSSVGARLRHQPKSWAYFTDSVAQNHSNRTKVIPLPPPQAHPPLSRYGPAEGELKAAIRKGLSGNG